MRYVQLRAFHHVAIQGGFSKAAQALHLTQPAISDQVRKLENEYDIRLFDRTRKQVSLTEKGLALLEITHRLFENESQALEFLNQSRTERQGTLRIVADSTHHIAQVLARYQNEFPGVFISIKSGNSEQVVEMLARYDADVGVLGNVPDKDIHRVVTLNSTPIIAFARKDSRFANFKSVSFTELATWPLVLREKGSKTRAKIEEQAKAAGLTLSVRIEAEGREAVSQIVADGGGVGIVSEAEFGYHQSLCKIPISQFDLTMEESIICLRERSHNPLISMFVTLAQQINETIKSQKPSTDTKH
jgi:aminoethylphosphonate catabolism LysR family transcriptional regulator